jgi:hypothetical protein
MPDTAKAEAERRYTSERYQLSHEYRREDFVAGAAWQREQPNPLVSDLLDLADSWDEAADHWRDNYPDPTRERLYRRVAAEIRSTLTQTTPATTKE